MLKKLFKNKIVKIAMITLVVVVVLFSGLLIIKSRKLVETSSNQVESTVEVARGDIHVTITGSGTVAPISRYEIIPLVNGNIISSPFEEGMEVKENDLLYRIDDSDATINIEKTRNSLTKLNISSQSNNDSIQNLKVTSPMTGRIIDFSMQVGDYVSDNTTIAQVVNDERLIANIPFNAVQLEKIEAGQDAKILISEYMRYIDGKVISKSSSGVASSEGAILFDVEIEMENPGALIVGTEVEGSVETAIGTLTSPELGEIDYADSRIIKAQSSGTVKEVYINDNEKVKEGQSLLTLENDDLYIEQQKNALELKDSQLTLESQQKNLEDYNIVSPIDGVVIKKYSKAGDTINNSNSNTILMVVADMSKMVFTLDIDELDIAKIQIGQKVSIDADALPEESFVGEVTNIAAEGESENGVTTYEVEVTIAEPGELKSGMNVNAEIAVQSKKDVLYVPIDAVQKNNNKNVVFVYKENLTKENTVKDANQMKQMKEVEIGISNEEYIEIISGVEEGEIVSLPNTMNGASKNQSQKNNSGFRMGGGRPPM